MTLRYFSFLAPLVLCGCAAEAASGSEDALLATDLTVRDKSGIYEFSAEIDPWIAPYPTVVRALREDSLLTKTGPENCIESLPCFDNTEWEMHFGGVRLVSVIGMTNSFYGGAHPAMSAQDRTFDIQTGQVLRFGDLFNSWSAAKALLQPQWCEAVRFSSHTTCPSLEDQALALSGGDKGASEIKVQTSDYAFGSYAEGSDSAYLSVTPQLIALVKPEYQSAFSLESNLCC